MSKSKKSIEDSYELRQAKLKRARDAKFAAVAKAAAVIDALWKMATVEDSAFSKDECEAVSDASVSLRSIQGGWVNRQGRRR